MLCNVMYVMYVCMYVILRMLCYCMTDITHIHCLPSVCLYAISHSGVPYLHSSVCWSRSNVFTVGMIHNTRTFTFMSNQCSCNFLLVKIPQLQCSLFINNMLIISISLYIYLSRTYQNFQQLHMTHCSQNRRI